MTDKSSDPQEKKIFVDEDWKTRVQAEKEAAKQEESNQKDPSDSPQTDTRNEIPLPPPSLAYLATSLATQAMMSLGLAHHPESQKSELRPQEAKHLIDTIAMLEEKTQGNRTPEESAMFNGFLHELRLAFVAVSQKSGDPDSKQNPAPKQNPASK